MVTTDHKMNSIGKNISEKDFYKQILQNHYSISERPRKDKDLKKISDKDGYLLLMGITPTTTRNLESVVGLHKKYQFLDHLDRVFFANLNHTEINAESIAFSNYFGQNTIAAYFHSKTDSVILKQRLESVLKEQSRTKLEINDRSFFPKYKAVFMPISPNLSVEATKQVLEYSFNNLAQFTEKDCILELSEQTNFHGVLSKIAKNANTYQMLEVIRRDINKGKFELFAQPILDINDLNNNRLKCELLQRQISPDGKAFSPSQAIETLRKTGFLSDFEYNGLDLAFSNLEKILGIYQKVSINISESIFTSQRCLDRLIDGLSSNRRYSNKVKLEVSENVSFLRDKGAIEILTDLKKEFGISLSMDDVGAGKQIYNPIFQNIFDEYKLDGPEIIRKLTPNPEFDEEKNRIQIKTAESVIKSLIEIAKFTDTKVVAEYIENEEILNKVKKLGIDYVQGFFREDTMPHKI